MPFLYTIIVLCVLRLAFQLGAALIGVLNGLWDGSGYPTATNVPTASYFSCTQQIQAAISNQVEFQSMARSFSYEMVFSVIVMGFAIWLLSITMRQRYSITKGTETSYGSQISLVIRKDRYIFLVVWISVSTLIFSVDSLRYLATSILTVEKMAFTWSSFCIAGPAVTIIDKLGSFFESLYLGFVYVIVLVAQSKQSLPAIDLDHGDRQCGLKTYLQYWKIVLMSLSGAILGFCVIWSVYINVIAMHPKDLWYAVTPLFAILLLTILYLSILDRANEISSEYEKVREFREAEIREQYNNREDVNAHLETLPKNPIEEQFGDNWLVRLMRGKPIFVPVVVLLVALVNDKTIKMLVSNFGLF